MNDDVFVEAICASPADHALRLIYADWLEERGDPRSRLLRLEDVLRQTPIHSDRYRSLEVRRDKMRMYCDREWLHSVFGTEAVPRPSADEPHMVTAEDIRVGRVLRLGGGPWQVVDPEWLHGKKYPPPVRLYVRSPSGTGRTTLELSYDQAVELWPLTVRPLLFLFREDAGCVFLDPATGAQYELAVGACCGREFDPEAGATVVGSFCAAHLVAVEQEEDS